MTPPDRYSRTAISLHWLVALLVFAGWGLGWYMQDLPASPAKLRYVSWHKWLGVSVFLLAIARAAWRMTHHPPPLPASTEPWQVAVARLSHFLLYVLMLALPLSGWLMSSARGFQTVWFGLVPLPDLLAKDEALGRFLVEIHRNLAYALAALVALHVLAAAKHHFIDRDVVLRRMLPFVAVLVSLGASSAGSVDTAQSQVTAKFRQMNATVEGRFTSFRGDVLFDPADPAAARAQFEVDTASFDLGSEEYNDEVRGKEWFDSAAHPRATFVSSKVAAIGSGSFTAEGTLTLKGRAAPVTIPFTVSKSKAGRVFEGRFTLSRKAYAIGDAEWDGVLDDPVVVRFRIVTQTR
jgi:cytochrome b561